MRLVITEKPSVAQSLSKVIGARERKVGYLEGNGYLVSWCVGHLVELAPPEAYDERYKRWREKTPYHVVANLPYHPQASWSPNISGSPRQVKST